MLPRDHFQRRSGRSGSVHPGSYSTNPYSSSSSRRPSIARSPNEHYVIGLYDEPCGGSSLHRLSSRMDPPTAGPMRSSSSSSRRPFSSHHGSRYEGSYHDSPIASSLSSRTRLHRENQARAPQSYGDDELPRYDSASAYHRYDELPPSYASSSYSEMQYDSPGRAPSYRSGPSNYGGSQGVRQHPADRRYPEALPFSRSIFETAEDQRQRPYGSIPRDTESDSGYSPGRRFDRNPLDDPDHFMRKRREGGY